MKVRSFLSTVLSKVFGIVDEEGGLGSKSVSKGSILDLRFLFLELISRIGRAVLLTGGLPASFGLSWLRLRLARSGTRFAARWLLIGVGVHRLLLWALVSLAWTQLRLLFLAMRWTAFETFRSFFDLAFSPLLPGWMSVILMRFCRLGCTLQCESASLF